LIWAPARHGELGTEMWGERQSFQATCIPLALASQPNFQSSPTLHYTAVTKHAESIFLSAIADMAQTQGNTMQLAEILSDLVSLRVCVRHPPYTSKPIPVLIQIRM